MKQEIGIVTLVYKEDGSLEEAAFLPTITVHSNKELVDELMTIKCSEETKEVQSRAEAVLASWFNMLTEIEIADRDQYTIKSDIKKCEKWPNGKIHTCEILFLFDKI